MEEVRKEGQRGWRRKLRIRDLLNTSSNTVALGIVHRTGYFSPQEKVWYMYSHSQCAPAAVFLSDR